MGHRPSEPLQRVGPASTARRPHLSGTRRWSASTRERVFEKPVYRALSTRSRVATSTSRAIGRLTRNSPTQHSFLQPDSLDRWVPAAEQGAGGRGKTDPKAREGGGGHERGTRFQDKRRTGSVAAPCVAFPAEQRVFGIRTEYLRAGCNEATEGQGGKRGGG